MGLEVLVISQKYYNEYYNGINFNNNLTDYTSNFTGSVMGNQMVNLVIDINWRSDASVSNKFTLQGPIITRATGNWADDGFSIGDLVEISGFLPNGTAFGPFGPTTANSVVDGTMILDFDLSTVIPEDTYELFTVTGLTNLSALIHKFSLIENSDPFGTQNIITGSDSAYYGSNMIEGGGWVNFQGLGQNKDWEDGGFRARKIYSPLWRHERFEIEHRLLIPFYAEGDNLSLLPPYLDGLNSLKYVFESGFRSVISNPNTQKAVAFDSQLGSVAGFNENFNGFDNLYNIASIIYQDANTLTSADGLLIGGTTKVTCVVKKNNGAFVGGERFGTYASYLPNQNEYQNTTLTDFKENFIYDRVLTYEGGGVAASTIITNVTGIVSAGKLTITFEVGYSVAQQIRLANSIAQRPIAFAIGIQIGDINLPAGNSDRVMLLAEGLYDKSADIEDLMDVNLFDIYPHNRQISSSTGFSDMIAWNEDGLAIDFAFDLDLNKDALINSLDFKLIAENSTTGDVFELDSFNYPIAGAVISNGVQQLNVATSRGYILENNDQFNDVTINVGANVGGLQSYNGRFAQKVSWQEWIENLDVNTVFYDNGEPFNNFNDKASNYSALNGYEVKLAISANVYGTNPFGISGLTDYLFLSPSLKVFDYEKDGNVTPVWSGVIETFNPLTSSNLNGAILTGQNTLFRTTWTNVAGAVTSLDGIWGINRIEIANQLGFDITELSSINTPATNQLLIPSTGALLDVYLSGGSVVMDCLIDGSLASSGVNYNLSSRINSANVPPFLKVTSPSGTQKDTSGVIDSKNTSI